MLSNLIFTIVTFKHISFIFFNLFLTLLKWMFLITTQVVDIWLLLASYMAYYLCIC
jgi:hypothetical protein